MDHHDNVAELRRAVLETPGAASPDVRRAAFTGSGVPEIWTAYVDNVREASYRVTGAEVDALRTAGASEDAILEVTLAAAVGAAQRRLDAGLRALGQVR